MNELLSDKLWPHLRRIARRSASKMAAVAYVTTDAFVEFGEGDTLVVDATDAAVAGGVTDAAVIGRAYERGTEVYSCPGLHAKVLVLGRVAVIGSANMSATSADDKVEAAWVTDNPTAVGMASSFIRETARSSIPVDEKFVRRIKSLEVLPRQPRAGSRKRKGFRPRVARPRTWLIGTYELKREFPREARPSRRGRKPRRRGGPANEAGSAGSALRDRPASGTRRRRPIS